MSLLDGMALVLAAVGTFFFCAGSIGLLRLPDIYSRLHALTKADNLGLGLIVMASILWSDSALTVIKLCLVWVFILIASSCLCILIAREAYQHKVPTAGEEES